jgi:putative FmdB family regulatory protein
MPTYEYRCPSCAEFLLNRPMHVATSTPAPCPRCTAPSPRVFRAPGLHRTPVTLARALGAAEASQEQPAIVRTSAAGRTDPPPIPARAPHPPLPKA